MQVTQVFRPVSMKDWFMIDPVLDRVHTNSAVNGVKAEVAEAVSTPDGLVIWRISGLAQRAETAMELEDGLQKTTSVNIGGTLKVGELLSRFNLFPLELTIRIQIKLPATNRLRH